MNLSPAYTTCTPEKFGNTTLFLRLGLPSTLIRHENGAFGKRSSNRRNLKRRLFRWKENNLKTELFENNDHDNRVISLPEFFQTNPK